MIYHKPPFLLEELKLEVSYRCPLNCIHCSSDGRPSNDLEMAHQDCWRILRSASEMGVKHVAFSGGEPLIWPHINDAVRLAAEQGMGVVVYTSGNVDEFEHRARDLATLGVRSMVFSIFGAQSEIHDRITRVKGSFRVTMNAIRIAAGVEIRTEVHFVPMSQNYRDLSGIAAAVKKAGAQRISVLRLVPQGRAALLRRRVLSRSQNLELANEIRRLRHSGFELRTGSPYNFLLLNKKPGCMAAINRAIVAPDLMFYPCDAFKRYDTIQLGLSDAYSNLAHFSLQECWSKSSLFGEVRQYLTSDFPPPCNDCLLLNKCLSGCLAQKVIASHSFKKQPDPDCIGPQQTGVTA